MARGLSVDRVVNVVVNLQPKAAPRRSFGILCLAGDTDVIDGKERLRNYTGLEAVAEDFGLSAPEYKAAVLYFGQSPRPKMLMVGRWMRAASAAILRGSDAVTDLASWVPITTGAMKLDVGGVLKSITGLDFSGQTTMNGVAAVISAKLAGNGAACVWDGSRFVITSTGTGKTAALGYATAPATGVDISDMAGLTAAKAFAPIPGFDAETPTACALALADASGEWYGLSFAASVMPTVDESLAVAAFIEAASRSRMAGFTITDERCLSSTYTEDLGSRLKAKGYKRSLVQYSSDSPYAVASLLARAFTVNFAGSKTTLTLKFKQEPGVTFETLAESQAKALTAKNINMFVGYDNDTAIIEEGVVASGAYFDEIHGADWLQNAIQTNCWNVLYQSATKVPQTEGGVTQLINATAQALKQGVTNGLIAPGTWNADGFGHLAQGDYLPSGWYIYSTPLVDQAQSDREARKSPPIQCAVKYAGAIHSVDMLVSVNR
jgi:hypothetical protein